MYLQVVWIIASWLGVGPSTDAARLNLRRRHRGVLFLLPRREPQALSDALDHGQVNDAVLSGLLKGGSIAETNGQ